MQRQTDPKGHQRQRDDQPFLEAVDQFERIMNDSGYVHLERMTEDDISGTAEHSGILEQYLTLSEKAILHCRISSSDQKKCVSETIGSVCIPYPIPMKICPVLSSCIPV
jgi:hypothetical protein